MEVIEYNRISYTNKIIPFTLWKFWLMGKNLDLGDLEINKGMMIFQGKKWRLTIKDIKSISIVNQPYDWRFAFLTIFIWLFMILNIFLMNHFNPIIQLFYFILFLYICIKPFFPIRKWLAITHVNNGTEMISYFSKSWGPKQKRLFDEIEGIVEGRIEI